VELSPLAHSLEEELAYLLVAEEDGTGRIVGMSRLNKT